MYRYMKTKTMRHNPISIQTKRWASYAAAGAATALAGGSSAEAAIHYSGLLHERFLPGEDHQQVFQLVDQTGVSLFFERLESNNLAACSLIGGGHNGGILVNYFTFPLRLSFGQYISDPAPGGEFWGSNDDGFPLKMAYGSGGYHSCSCSRTFFGHPGTGFVGFRFDTGAGFQYGWVRVKMTGRPENAFRVIDYAYADPGEPITAGQRSSDPQTPDKGSLGWLAVGAVGLLAWRKSRSRTARHTKLPPLV